MKENWHTLPVLKGKFFQSTGMESLASLFDVCFFHFFSVHVYFIHAKNCVFSLSESS